MSAMICYQCRDTIADGDPFYSDYDKYICKPCFGDARRCFTCRFPGNQLQEVQGLGLECEFCRGNLVQEGMELESMVAPLRSFLLPFGFRVPEKQRWVWTERLALRELQSSQDLPPEDFIDDYLRYSYPVYYHEGALHLLPRLTKPTFIAYTVVQLAAGELAGQHALPNLAGKTPFHTFARGWCHWLGYEASRLLGYDLERRQLRKWPELGAQGEFERWDRMSQVNKAAKMVPFFQANLRALVKKHLTP